MKSIKHKFFIILILLYPLFFGCDNKVQDSVESIAIPVKVEVAEKTSYTEQLSYTGILRPIKEMKLMSEIPGKVSKIYVDEGAKVVRGQLLAEMDVETIKLHLAQAEAGLSVATASLNSAKKDWERFQKLSEEEAVSQMQSDKVTLGYEAAQAQLKQAEAAYNMALHSSNVSMIRAPFSGVISAQYVEEGDFLNPQMSMGGVAAVFSIMDYSKIEVKIEVDERHIKSISNGMKALLRTNTEPNKVYQGRVITVNHAADPISRSFSVKVKFDNSNYELLPNTVGEINVILLEKPNTFSFPLTTLIEDQFVYTVKGGKAVRNKVRVGHLSETNIEITEGIAIGDTVIIKGSYALRADSRVIIE